MTKALSFSAIRVIVSSIGRELTIKKTAFGEYRVSASIPAIQMANQCDYNVAKERNEAIAYYCEDAAEALQAARTLHARYVETAKF